jgi:hypothetical protein
VGPGTGLDNMEKREFLPLQGLELQPLGHLACNQSLYRLRYPGSLKINYKVYVLLNLNPLLGIARKTHTVQYARVEQRAYATRF